jgi:hypothetical protein
MIIGIGLLVAITAVIVGAIATLVSDYTGGQYVHQLVLTAFALAALGYARGPDVRERVRRPDRPEPGVTGTTYTRTG